VEAAEVSIAHMVDDLIKHHINVCRTPTRPTTTRTTTAFVLHPHGLSFSCNIA
jgi:hypothetical protein